MKRTVYTAESVCEGHPDKLCDLVADAILDECLMEDENARVACEVLATVGKIVVAGEITAVELPNIERIVLQTVEAVGYDPEDYEVEVLVHNQSQDIADGVELPAEGDPDEQGAGDQGVMYGYATDETPEMLPVPCVLAHSITRFLTVARIEGLIKGLKPDGKAQVSIAYEDGVPKEATAIVVSVQHDEDKDMDELENEVKALIVFAALKDFPMAEDAQLLVNPSGRFVMGGPEADTGVTGRKLMVDSYGGFIPHGGGAFSGKDASKVDRSGAYMARYIAKNIVAAKLAERCLVSLAYAIGVAEPVSVCVNTYGTGVIADEDAVKVLRETFDMRPGAIIRTLDLRKPQYKALAAYGHFGRTELGVKWEETDMADRLAEAAKAYR